MVGYSRGESFTKSYPKRRVLNPNFHNYEYLIARLLSSLSFLLKGLACTTSFLKKSLCKEIVKELPLIIEEEGKGF